MRIAQLSQIENAEGMDAQFHTAAIHSNVVGLALEVGHFECPTW